MNLNELLSNLEAIDLNQYDNKENNDIIHLYFINKKRKSNNYEYYSYSPSISKKVQEKIKEITVNKINKIKGIKQCKYNPSGCMDNTIETCERNFVKNIEIVMSSLKNENQLEKMLNINDIHSYCFEFNHKDKEIIVFKRFTKMKRVREGFFGIFEGGSFSSIKGDILGIDNDIDVILYEKEFLILKHISLERIFDLKNQFKSQAKQTINMIKSKNIILNFDKFEEDALDNLQVIKRLTKIREKKTLPLFFNNFDKVVQVSKSFDLGIIFNEKKNKIIYKDKSQIEQITLLMNDAYYKTLIGGQKGYDELK